MSARKEEIIEGLIGYLFEHGPAGLSLRPMASSIGTSARLLIFHFGSKDGLMVEVLEEVQSRLQRSLSGFIGLPLQAGRPAPLRLFWDWAIADSNLPYLRLMYELQMLAAKKPKQFGKLLKLNSMSWLDLVRAALPQSLRSAHAVTLFCGVFDGLFLEFLLTGDRERTTRALDLFIEMGRKLAVSENQSRVSAKTRRKRPA